MAGIGNSSQNSGKSNANSAGRGSRAHNKDSLKSDGSNTMSAKPAARKDQFGSAHHDDAKKNHQRKLGAPGGKSDLDFRESAQALKPVKGAANRLPGSRSPKSGDQKHHRAK